MTLKNYVDGNKLYAAELNPSFAEAYTMGAMNLIRQLQTATVTFSKGMIDWWGDAYTSATGRMSSVTTASTSLYSTSLYYTPYLTNESATDTTNDPDTFTNPSYAFDENTSTSATKSSATSSTTSWRLGKTFSTKTVGLVRIKGSVSINSVESGYYLSMYLETYNGSVWTSVATLVNTINVASVSYDSVYNLNSSVQGVRINFTRTSGGGTKTMTATLTELDYGAPSAGTIVHTIPAGTFSSTISKAVGVPHIALWETGADIQYKLTNGSEDSGWLSCANTPAVSSFTAFTSEPTTLTVKLVPKSSSPTSGYPAIYGFAVRAA